MYFVSPIEVCPTSILDAYLWFILEAEQAVREYHTLPYDGGLWDQPNPLLDAFTAIRIERAQYERVRFERMRKKSEKGGGQQDMKFRSPNVDLPPRSTNIGS